MLSSTSTWNFASDRAGRDRHALVVVPPAATEAATVSDLSRPWAVTSRDPVKPAVSGTLVDPLTPVPLTPTGAATETGLSATGQPHRASGRSA